tara:strand:+ start:135 stop:434 length:300 start_codon:yes stop_codon:yes gene_type:complete
MTNKKKSGKDTKVKPTSEYRSLEERKLEINRIITSLVEYRLSLEFYAIKELYILFKRYIDEGERILINIPFPEMNKRIEGVLAINKNEEVAIRLKYEKF